MDAALALLKKFRSRKWLLTLIILTIAVAFSTFDTLTPQLSNVLMSAGVSYNGFQGLIDWKKTNNNE